MHSRSSCAHAHTFISCLSQSLFGSNWAQKTFGKRESAKHTLGGQTKDRGKGDGGLEGRGVEERRQKNASNVFKIAHSRAKPGCSLLAAKSDCWETRQIKLSMFALDRSRANGPTKRSNLGARDLKKSPASLPSSNLLFTLGRG